ncbi:MAG: hypothetical protein CMQ34_10560 [Gammaproteobacteria bacterium]|nr:hypothetical protein [Gammaproteobacteria bacterium]
MVILGLNAAVAALAYFFVYPKFCGANGWRIAANDLLATATVVIVSGVLYAGTGVAFNFLFFSTNWFWFALLSYLVIETPLMLWYFNKHDVWRSLKF